MKILAIIGSPRKHGNTYELTHEVESKMKELDDTVTFEYLYLSESGLEPCRGCLACILNDESLCPIKDSQAEIEAKMAEADGVILASPVYLLNMCWLTKVFLDRYAYIAHRPRFHKKKAIVISTTGAVGLKVVLPLLAMPLSFWGFKVVHQLGACCPPTPVSEKATAQLEKKRIRAVDKAAHAFYKALQVSRPAPGLVSLTSFLFQKKAFAQNDDNSPDRRYWKAQGWLEKEIRYVYPVRIGFFKWVLARVISQVMWISIPKL